MTDTQGPLSVEEHDLLEEVMDWAFRHRMEPAQSAESLIRVARTIQMAILHLNQVSTMGSTESRGTA